MSGIIEKNQIRFLKRTLPEATSFECFKDFGIKSAERVTEFHRSFPEYAPTPLCELKEFAQSYGVGSIFIKDESFRFGLNAFKALGGSYAIGNYIAEWLKKNTGVSDDSALTYDVITSDETRKAIGDVTFITATDGNHGRGVAWTANRLGQKSVVYMPKGTAKERLDNILKLGSDASITDMCYDDCVRKARSDAEKNGWVIVQDTSWEGYETVPKHIMQGYLTMALEAYEQMKGMKPTHLFVQAGVGSMAAAMAAFFTMVCCESENGFDMSKKPIITVVEPTSAGCMFETAKADDGKLHFVTEEMDSMMAGLCCGEPCPPAWDILRECAENFVTIPDSVAAGGMRILAGAEDSADNDAPKIISGESGASTFGLVAEVLRNPEMKELKEALKLDKDSIILCFSTEGDTDKENYTRIINKVYKNDRNS